MAKLIPDQRKRSAKQCQLLLEDIFETVQPPHNEPNRPLAIMTEGHFFFYPGHRQEQMVDKWSGNGGYAVQ
jgi:hypothetical protein